ncbi:MAG: hypothetical protein HY531_02235 [Chloroflexi bacterium]|nr:hypothetical protein [Chloroflexota bacterium]
MTRGATLTHPLEMALLVQRGLTVAISGHNAFYFARYRSRQGRRRLGAVVLALINLAIAGESVAFGLLPWALNGGDTGLTLGSQLVAASLSMVVALTIGALILRQRTRKR